MTEWDLLNIPTLTFFSSPAFPMQSFVVSTEWLAEIGWHRLILVSDRLLGTSLIEFVCSFLKLFILWFSKFDFNFVWLWTSFLLMFFFVGQLFSQSSINQVLNKMFFTFCGLLRVYNLNVRHNIHELTKYQLMKRILEEAKDNDSHITDKKAAVREISPLKCYFDLLHLIFLLHELLSALGLIGKRSAVRPLEF